MSAISDFKGKYDVYNKEISDDLDSIVTQVKGMNDLIAKLQASQGQVTAEDQALLDQLDAAGKSLASKADATANKTPPTPPTP